MNKKLLKLLADISNCIEQYGEITCDDPKCLGTHKIYNDAHKSLEKLENIFMEVLNNGTTNNRYDY